MPTRGYYPGTRTRQQAAFGRNNFLTRAIAGLAAPNIHGGVFGGFQAGLSGALAQGQASEAAAAEAEKERLRSDLEERLFGLNERRTTAEEQRAAADLLRAQAPESAKPNIGAIPWYENLPDTDPRKVKYREDALRPPGSGMAEDAPIIDDQTLNDYADALATSGAFPALGGFGKYGTKVKLLIGQRASQRHPGLNIAKAASDYKANQAALSKIMQSSSGLEAFSETAKANADILLEEVNSIPEFNNRILNSVARRTAAVMGDPHIARFNTALETVVPEFARILQSGGQIIGQPLTDTQKKDLRAVLHGDFTGGQLRASIGILKREVANRKAAQEKVISELQNKINPYNAPVGGAERASTVEELGAKYGF